MEITSYYNLLSSLVSASSTTSGASSGTDSSSESIFGPAAFLALGQTVAGMDCYSGLLATLPTTTSSSVWQFDLVSALTPSSTGMTEIERSPEQEKAEEAAIEEALNDLDAGETDEARSLMDELLAQNKTNSAATQVLGLVEQAEGNYAKAEQLFLKANALDPTAGYDMDAENARTLQQDDEAVLTRARGLLATSDRSEDGVRLLIALTERSPENTEAHMLLGSSLLSQDDAMNGLMQYSTAIRTANTEQLGQLETRLTTLAKAAPKIAFLQQLVGRVQLRQGHYEEAVQTLTHAADLLGEDETGDTTDLARAYVGLGREQLKTGDLNSAMSNFSQAEALAPTDHDVKTAIAEGYTTRAEKFTSQRQYASALEYYQKTANLLGETGDDDVRTRAAHGAFTLGQALRQKRVAAGDEIDEEVVAYQLAHELATDNTTYTHKLAETRNAIGDQLLADGEYKDAAGSYAQAYALDKNNTTYKNNTINAWIAYGDHRLANLNYTDGVDAYKEAYKLDATNLGSRQKLADAYTTRGLYLKSEDEMELAVADFKEALRLFPDNQTYQDNYNALKGWDT